MNNVPERAEPKKKYQNQFIFEYLRNILHDKSEKMLKMHLEDTENMKSFPGVVIFRYLSMCPVAEVREFMLRNHLLLERLDKMGHDKTYRYLFDNVPKTSITFIKYIK